MAWKSKLRLMRTCRHKSWRVEKGLEIKYICDAIKEITEKEK